MNENNLIYSIENKTEITKENNEEKTLENNKDINKENINEQNKESVIKKNNHKQIEINENNVIEKKIRCWKNIFKSLGVIKNKLSEDFIGLKNKKVIIPSFVYFSNGFHWRKYLYFW